MIQSNKTNLYTVLWGAICTLVSLSVVLTSASVSAASQPELATQSEPESSLGFFDRSHAYLSSRVNEPAIWFDNFFGNPRLDDDEIPTSFVRLRFSAIYTEGEGTEFPVRLRANIKLPRASRKLRLVVVGESDEELLVKKTGDRAAGISDDVLGEEKNSVGLRYTMYQTLRSKFNFGGGISKLSPFEYYGKVSYRRLLHSGGRNAINFEQLGVWDSVDGFSETSQLDFERALTDKVAIRLVLSGTYYDTDPEFDSDLDPGVNNGLNWAVETSLFKQLSDKTAASFDLGAFGLTRPETETTNYRVATRVRANVLRPWLFFEVEPQVTFPLQEIGGRRAVGAITLLTEVQFSSLR